MKKAVVAVGALAVAAALWWWFGTRHAPEPGAPATETTRRTALIPEVEPKPPRALDVTDRAEESPAEQPPAETPEEKAAAEAEKLVEAFDALTDAWQEPVTNGVSLADTARFVAAFNRVPKDRKDECLHRALNLIPDENVMLLAGVLMDKSQEKEYVEMVFNDVLNRDEDVKKPILQEIFKDRTHPCWADTAWIFDVTGEKPVGKGR